MSKLIVTTIEDASGASGTVTFTGSIQAVDFNSTSDARLKTEITNIEGGLDKVGTTHTLFRSPGVATVLQNFESSIHGGYRRVSGFTKFGSNQPNGSADDIEGIYRYAKGVVACQGANIYYSTDGSTWTQVNKNTYKVEHKVTNSGSSSGANSSGNYIIAMEVQV